MANIKFKIRKDDTVQVLAGKDKGKRGTVVRVLTKKDAVIVSGVNIVKKAMKSVVNRIKVESLRSKLRLIFQMWESYVKNAVAL